MIRLWVEFELPPKFVYGFKVRCKWTISLERAETKNNISVNQGQYFWKYWQGIGHYLRSKQLILQLHIANQFTLWDDNSESRAVDHLPTWLKVFNVKAKWVLKSNNILFLDTRNPCPVSTISWRMTKVVGSRRLSKLNSNWLLKCHSSWLMHSNCQRFFNIGSSQIVAVLKSSLGLIMAVQNSTVVCSWIMAASKKWQPRKIKSLKYWQGHDWRI